MPHAFRAEVFVVTTIKMTDIADWVFEGVLQFLRSPLWTTPVYGFIEQHCHVFDPDDPENKLVYTELHRKFREMIDELLSSYLDQLGVSAESFIEAIKCGVNSELSGMVSEFIFALDDFRSFRAMMEKRNVELELEAMYEYAKYTSQALDDSQDDMTDDERFLFEMAIHLSLGEGDIAMKRLQKEDAELMQALAFSMAIEQERLLFEQLAAENAENGDGQTKPQRTVEEIHEEIRRQRVENVERAVQDIHSSPPAKTDVSKLIESRLAPLQEKRPQGFTKGAALPSIGGSTTAKPPEPLETPAVREPTFTELRQQAEAKFGKTSQGTEPSPEELAQRAAYFRAQREKLLQQRNAQRQEALQQYQKENQLPEQQPKPAQVLSEQDSTKEMRLALARRFKDDLLQETKKSAPQ
jgi:hypothetical protein